MMQEWSTDELLSGPVFMHHNNNRIKALSGPQRVNKQLDFSFLFEKEVPAQIDLPEFCDNQW